MTEPGLRDRFTRLWKRLGGSTGGTAAFDALLRAYGEPHRHYHTLGHLQDCLARLDEACAPSPTRDIAEAALWYHDAVYVPAASDNEIRSAEEAAARLGAAGVPLPTIGEVARLVLLTDHARPPADPLGQLVCDVDLSILGRRPADFDEYERRIRAEYRQVPDPLYRAGRAAILDRLLSRPSLYGLAHFRSRYERAARRNLHRSLRALQDEPPT